MSNEIINNQVNKGLQSATPNVTVQAVQAQTVNRQDEVQEAGNVLPPETQQKEEVSRQELQEVVEQLNDHVQTIQRDLNFSIDEASGKTIIRVMNTETAELIRQIPSDEVLRISRQINEQKEQYENKAGLIFSSFA